MSTGPTGPTRDERPDPFGLKGTTVRDEFAIVACVAEGGFGVVYYAEQKPFGRPVAFKVLKPATTQSAEVRAQQAEAFIAECKITARLQVPNIAQALSAGTLTLPDGQPASWVALNWVPGQPLHRWLKERRRHVRAPLTPREALDLLRPVLVALARVHTEHEVAHRDLKPGNIMITPRGDGYETHVLDFGIAKAMPSIGLPATGMTMSESALQMFSPQYAAPEQVAATKTGLSTSRPARLCTGRVG